MDSLLDFDLMAKFDAVEFRSQDPYPWYSYQHFLKQAAFERLFADFPDIALFEKHSDVQRPHGQRPHNRYYLAYEASIYHEEKTQGVVGHERLPQSWRNCIEELRAEKYQNFIRELFECEKMETRFAWHLGHCGSDVSPHIDAPKKLGTHLFYFNKSDEWDTAWGGSTVVLGGKRGDAMNPEFSDFEMRHAVDFVDNRSVIFQNKGEAWHGVEAMDCPEGNYRRLFSVVFDRPEKKTLLHTVVRSLTKRRTAAGM